MGKYLIVIFWGIVFIVVTVLVVRALRPDEERIEVMQEQYRYESDPSNIVEPEMVAVTMGDSLYHKPTCSWIGSRTKRMSSEKAIDQGFVPCPYCIEEDY